MPDRPTDKEVEEHNVTHTPPKPCCPYRAMGTGTRDPHSRIRKEVSDVEIVMAKVPTVFVDFMHLFEKGGYPS